MRENKLVNVLGALLFVSLMGTMVLGAAGIYWYGRSEEKKRFSAAYNAYAHRIVDSFHDAVARRLGAIDALANTITSHAIDTQQEFPLVTIPHFALRGSDTRVQVSTK